jgi:predicted short-subunit dehydrogenase-like oxidoreductase (DUF2520 family)
MRIALVGPGRAGTAVALAASRADHRIVSVSGRRPAAVEAVAALFGATPLPLDAVIGPADLMLIAVRDDAITAVAAELQVTGVTAAVHVSGAVPVAALEPLAADGAQLGSFHPLQTLPTAEAGAAAIPGAWVAVTAAEPLRQRLFALAASLGATPFLLADADKPLYHAAAAAAANFPLVSLMMAEALFTAAGVPFAAARPLVDAVIANAFDIGPAESLTGPVARGDVDTVRRQVAAVAAAAPEWEAAFRNLVAHTAAAAGRSSDFAGTDT